MFVSVNKETKQTSRKKHNLKLLTLQESEMIRQCLHISVVTVPFNGSPLTGVTRESETWLNHATRTRIKPLTAVKRWRWDAFFCVNWQYVKFLNNVARRRESPFVVQRYVTFLRTWTAPRRLTESLRLRTAHTCVRGMHKNAAAWFIDQIPVSLSFIASFLSIIVLLVLVLEGWWRATGKRSSVELRCVCRRSSDGKYLSL